MGQALDRLMKLHSWTVENLPLFDCSDGDILTSYYYRAKSYKSHIVHTDYVDITHIVTEFGPSVPWGGVYGTINAAAGHHLSEGRWIRDRKYMHDLTRFWIGSQAQTGGGDQGNTDAFEPTIGHFANGTKGKMGNTPYSSWILTGAIKAAQVSGNLDLGLDFHNNSVTFADVLGDVIKWWEERSVQLRVDCIVANDGNTVGNASCLDSPPDPTGRIPYCYVIADGWDAMEGSVSGNGCHPTIGSMMWSEALAIATVANMTGNITLAQKFSNRAEYIREWYLEHLWNEETQFFSVFKEGLEFHGEGANMNKTKAMAISPCDDGCACVPPATSHDAATHGPVACRFWNTTCNGTRMPTADKDRGKDYNHSTFLDLVIEGLVGLRAVFGRLLVIDPQADAAQMDYFALDNVLYHGHNTSVVWDNGGAHWSTLQCNGLCVYVNHTLRASVPSLQRVEITLES